MNSSTFHISHITNTISCIRRVFILFMVCLFIASCMSSAEYIGNNDHLLVTTAITAHNTGSHTTELTTQTDGNTQEATPVHKNRKTTDTDKNNNAPADPNVLLQSIDIEHHIDPHHTGDEEKVMAIDLPGLIRILLMLVVIIIII